MFPTYLHAYIDPGSGSALITAVLGFFAAIAYSFRKFFYNLRSKLKRTEKESMEESVEESKLDETQKDID
tara:strand:+ start:471 stop:680 length:210 start_codon:yes stop_codon:yes gene_type:complete